MNVLVSGAHGLIGSALTAALRAEGHRVIPLIRGPVEPLRLEDRPAGTEGVGWDPTTASIDLPALEAIGPVDAAVNLAGAGIGDRRWTGSRRRLIVSSRQQATLLLAQTLAAMSPRPAVLVSASAVGYYGDGGRRTLPESAPSGSGFLPEVCRSWEAATAPAADAGVRVVLVRSGIVLSASGGMLARLLPLFRLGLGGRLGDGRQYMSWITLRDEVSVLRSALGDQRLSGPLNAVAPTPVTNAEFTAALGRALHRPTLLGVPKVALRCAFGRELADELLLAGQRAEPALLESVGQPFADPTIDAALASVLQPAG
jgi:uncharacterized protein (TIGR01777 family)